MKVKIKYRQADRLVMIWERSQRRNQNVINLGNFFDWKAQSASFEDMAAFADFRTNLTGDGESRSNCPPRFAPTICSACWACSPR